MVVGLLIGGVILVAVGAAGAWLTRVPDTAPRVAKASEANRAAATAASPPTSIVVPQAAAPPEPTSTDFASAAPPPTAPPATAPPATAPPAAESATAVPTAAVDWTALAIDELRAKANADEIPAMEEMARRLVQGVGVPKDQQAGAGWLLRAAQHGSAQSAFNVGVM